MGKTHTRTVRRHHIARLKAKRSTYCGSYIKGSYIKDSYIKTLPPEEQQRHGSSRFSVPPRCAITAPLQAPSLDSMKRKRW